jgi:hypothetical protein
MANKVGVEDDGSSNTIGGTASATETSSPAAVTTAC